MIKAHKIKDIINIHIQNHARLIATYIFIIGINAKNGTAYFEYLATKYSHVVVSIYIIVNITVFHMIVDIT